ncbi:hypothetical protein GOB42_15050 [Sinorhizobium meliloti]|nr:hypothetical protein [Sinorhizobium meliloti]
MTARNDPNPKINVAESDTGGDFAGTKSRYVKITNSTGYPMEPEGFVVVKSKGSGIARMLVYPIIEDSESFTLTADIDGPIDLSAHHFRNKAGTEWTDIDEHNKAGGIEKTFF